MRKRHIVMLIFAVIFFWMGIYALTLELELADEGYALASGPLVLDYTAADPDVDLYLPFEYPLLSRTVEMAQYVKRGSVVMLELSTRDPDKRVEEKSGNKKTVYENPPFPKWIRRHAFFGEIIIISGDQKLRLHERLVRKIYFSESEGLDHKAERYVVARKLLKDEESWRNKKLIDQLVDTDDLEVGDIVVTWRSIKPDSLAPIYTVYGRVHDGVIGDEDHDVFFFDRGMTAEEFGDALFAATGTRTFGIGLLGIGAILVVIPIWAKFRPKKV